LPLEGVIEERAQMSRMPLFIRLCLLLVLTPGLPLRAELFKWVDDKGVTHYGDRIPPEYAKQGNTQLDKRGVTVRKIDPALTPEQRRAQQDEAERLKQALKQAEAQQRQDLALINTYSSEEEIDLARDRRVAQIDQIVLQAQHQSAELEKRTTTAAQELKRAKTPSAKALADEESAALAKRTAAMRAAIAKLNTDREEVIARFDQDKLRFREIKTNGVTSTRLSSVGRRPGEDRITELALNVNDALVTGCVNEWRDTVGNIGAPYAVSARLIGRGNREEVVVEGRARSNTTGQNQVRRWTCALTAERAIDKKETDVRKALASIGAQY
jgi:Domain of unknown function (DUF4124)